MINRIRVIRVAAIAFALCSGIGLGFFCWQTNAFQRDGLNPSDQFAIQNVRIEGDFRNLESERFVDIIAPWIGGSYFSLDLPKIAAVARSVPWVESAEVERLWPDTVILRINEHRPVARWGDSELLNNRGERFLPSPPFFATDLPLIEAPPGSEHQMLRAIAVLDGLMSKTGAHVVNISLNKRHSWFVKLSNDMEILFGRQDPILALTRFMGLLPKLGESRFNELARLDLRYPNGFAIVWKPLSARDAGVPESKDI